MKAVIGYRGQLILGFVLLTSLIEASVIGADVLRAWNERNEFLSQRASILAQSTAESLRVPLWNFDEITATNVLSALRLDPDVTSASIRDAAGLTFAEIGTQTDAELVTNQIAILAPTGSSDDQEPIGNLRLSLSQKRLDDFLRQRLHEAFIELAMLVALNFLVIFIVLRWLTRPLERLASAMELLAHHDYAVEVPYLSRDDEIGNVARAVDVFKRNGLELTELQNSMARKIEEQTVDLVRARDAAEAGARAKSQFLATMSHEIRTPMNGVLGMAQLLDTTTLDQDQRECVDVILDSGQDMMLLIDDVLDFSHLDNNEVILEEVAFDPVSLLEELAEEHRRQTSAKGLALRVEAEPTPAVLGDPTRLRQALMKIANNAVKFTDRGNLTLSLRHSEVGPGRSRLDFEISDTGVGISEDQFESIFETFRQVDQNSTRAFGGTGLGLAISRRIITVMGGDISVQSRLGAGSTFRVTLELPTA